MSALETLEEEGRVTVVMDERGKVVFVSEREMERVVEAIEKEGRVSLSRLTAVCDSNIELGAKWCVCWRDYRWRCSHKEEVIMIGVLMRRK